ncbi:DUF3899 domain-containing protein [Alkalihalobacillus sp. CinArs1]|uniref:DUF3899 domain-containing protein n=1 Tax=Alkalihalobacillus sp. CinArs1 TaxID=2995314 RepID=UPI0022DD2DCB|nr:DUF3899 domain-containing protein [Alkalihalobacillus sp. CinArs1]
MRRYGLALLGSFIVAFMFWFIQGDAIQFVNRSFYWGIIALTVGTILVVLKSGFLTLLFEGFSKIHRMIVPRSRSMERVDEQVKRDPSFTDWKERVLVSGILICYGAGTGLTGLSVAGVFLFI